jgi:polyhydroxyalkanoate synthesis regulator phasin
MKSLSTSERLIVEPALTSLADYLRSEIELVAELDAKYFPSGVQDQFPEEVDGVKTVPAIDPPFSFYAQKPLYEAEAALRRYGLSTEADEIIRLYDNSSKNDERTLEYVENLLADLDPGEAESLLPSKTEIERLQQLLKVLVENAAWMKDAQSSRGDIEELRRAIDKLAESLLQVPTTKQPLDGCIPESPNDLGDREAEKSMWLAQAMLCVQRHPDWSDAKIARMVNRHPSTLSRNTTYQMAAGMARGSKTDLPRGFVRTNEDGKCDVEAISHRDFTQTWE